MFRINNTLNGVAKIRRLTHDTPAPNPHFFQKTFCTQKNNENNVSLTNKYLNLVSKRFSEPTKELIRLQNKPSICNRLTKLNAYFVNNPFLEYYRPTINHQIAYGRSIEIFETFKSTHYVFHHGQSSSGFLALNSLTKIIFNLNKTKKLSAFQTILRHPVDLKNINPDLHTVEWYKKRIDGKDLNKDSDNLYTNSLISADGYLASIEQAESALMFFLSNSCRQVHIKNNSLINIISHYISDQDIRNDFINSFNTVDMKAIASGKGVLYSICVPKEYFSECGYVSRPFGIPEKLEENIDDTLKKMQEECLPGKEFPQIRLLSHKLDPDKVKIFISPCMEDKVYQAILDELHLLINKYFVMDSIDLRARRFSL